MQYDLSETFLENNKIRTGSAKFYESLGDANKG